MSGKTVLITGVTHGIGRAMAAEFARLGHIVLGCGRSRKEIDQLTETVFQGGTISTSVDVASNEDVMSWASLLLISHGAPDLLINNAGVINRERTTVGG
jgi:NAD(P)-dependent dehydrogenase (short-subunit alcohol dehydrogenase family)